MNDVRMVSLELKINNRNRFGMFRLFRDQMNTVLSNRKLKVEVSKEIKRFLTK